MRRAIALVACLAVAGCSKKEEEKAPLPQVEVKAAKAQVGEVQSGVTAPATVFPRAQANVSARAAAPIRQLLARKGDSVSAGQRLAVLENRDIAAQRDEAVAAVSEAQASLRKTTSGTIPGDIEKARAQLAAAEAAYNQSKTIVDRRQQLFQQGAIPQRELLVSQTELATTKANYDVAKTSLDLLMNQSREGDIKMAQDHLAQAQARLKGLEAQMTYTEIIAPFAGTITDQFMYPGDMAKPDAPMFTLMDMSTGVVRAQVPESDAAPLRPGQDCNFVSGDNADLKYNGKVTVVNRAVDLARRTVEVWCEVPKPPATMRAGQFGQMTVPLQKTSAVLVPKTAVQLNEGTRTGWVMIVDGKKARKRDVEVGEASGENLPVLKGLKGGEMVVTEGVYGLNDGVEVKLESEKDDKDKKDSKDEK